MTRETTRRGLVTGRAGAGVAATLGLTRLFSKYGGDDGEFEGA